MKFTTILTLFLTLISSSALAGSGGGNEEPNTLVNCQYFIYADSQLIIKFDLPVTARYTHEKCISQALKDVQNTYAYQGGKQLRSDYVIIRYDTIMKDHAYHTNQRTNIVSSFPCIAVEEDSHVVLAEDGKNSFEEMRVSNDPTCSHKSRSSEDE